MVAFNFLWPKTIHRCAFVLLVLGLDRYAWTHIYKHACEPKNIYIQDAFIYQLNVIPLPHEKSEMFDTIMLIIIKFVQNQFREK